MQSFNMHHDISGRPGGGRVIVSGRDAHGAAVAFSLPSEHAQRLAELCRSLPGAAPDRGAGSGARPGARRPEPAEPSTVTTFNMHHDVVFTPHDSGIRVSGAADVDGGTGPTPVEFVFGPDAAHGLGAALG